MKVLSHIHTNIDIEILHLYFLARVGSIGSMEIAS